MSLEERAKAAGKNLEGKAQEALGNVTGDPEDRAEGKVKQTEAEARNTKENIKDKAKQVVDRAENSCQLIISHFQPMAND